MIGAKIKKINAKPGYSLVELLVVMFLFSLSIVILSQTYVAFIRLSHKTANSAVIQQDMRFSLEYMARAVRNTPINYNRTITSGTSTLYLINQAGEETIIALSDVNAGATQCQDATSTRCLRVSKDGGVSWAPLTSKKVNVDAFKVFIYPTISPFVLQAGSYPNDNQPIVTIQMSLTYLAPLDKEKVSLSAQTSISSRQYER